MPLPIDTSDEGWRFLIPFETCNRSDVQIVYEQELSASRAAYLLTSTRAWDKPLDRARLEVVASEALGSVRTSIFMKQIGQVAGGTLFAVDLDDFLPTEDLIVEWKSPAVVP